jgi:hypothetical protein
MVFDVEHQRMLQDDVCESARAQLFRSEVVRPGTLQEIAYQQRNILIFHIPAERHDHNAVMISIYPSYLEPAYWLGCVFPPPRSHIEVCDPDTG